jgi:hypothetical protein
VKTPNGQKVVSTLLNQMFFADVQSILVKKPMSMKDIGEDEKEHIYAIKGGDMFVHKTEVENDVAGEIVRGDRRVEFKLDVSNDGNTAYLTMFVGERPLVASAQFNAFVQFAKGKGRVQSVCSTFAVRNCVGKIWFWWRGGWRMARPRVIKCGWLSAFQDKARRRAWLAARNTNPL